MSSSMLLKKLKSLTVVSFGSAFIYCGINYYQNDEKFFNNIAMPLLRLFEPETAQNVMIRACHWNLIPVNNYQDPDTLVRTNK
jgi:hypothetical protein